MSIRKKILCLKGVLNVEAVDVSVDRRMDTQNVAFTLECRNLQVRYLQRNTIQPLKEGCSDTHHTG